MSIVEERLVHALLLALAVASLAWATPVTIDQVPAYDWYHGCTPTAAGMIVGYWDLHGYPNLFDASGSDVFLTSNVQDQISSPAHNAKYDSYPDSSGAAPADTSIADFLHTSEGGLGFGSTYIAYEPGGIAAYAAYRGYSFNAWLESWAQFSWNQFVSEINAGHPMLFNVDSNGDGIVDHSVTAVGYDDRGGTGEWYGVYTTWSETVAWYQFRPASSSYSWGLYSAADAVPLDSPVPVPLDSPVTVPLDSPVPEPGTFSFSSIAAVCVGFAIYWRRRKHPTNPGA